MKLCDTVTIDTLTDYNVGRRNGKTLDASIDAACKLGEKLNKAVLYADNKAYYNFAQQVIKIEKVIFHDPATIVFWNTGDKTVVKCGRDDKYDPEVGLAMCIAKYFLGSRRQIKQTCKKFGVKFEQKPKRARWVHAYNDVFRCSKCGWMVPASSASVIDLFGSLPKYCDSCKSKMMEVQF